MKRTIQILLFCFFVQTAFAQQSKYDYAKQLIKEEKYAQSIAVLESVLGKSTDGIYPNALYLHAFSKYKLGKQQVAKQSLYKLIEQFPGWSGVNQAKYLMATINFEYDLPLDGMKVLEQLEKESDWRVKTRNLKKEKLGEYSLGILKSVYGKYSNDEIIGKILLTKLYEEGNNTDESLTLSLQEKFNLDGGSKEEVKKIVKKESYNVAVLMPFQKNKLQSTSYNFVTGLYEGVLMANEGLIKEGVQISLYAFDTNRDSATTANILANPDMMGMDLILGVMYSNSLPLVQKFSAENGVPFVNPMSENVSGIEANPNAFLLNASTQRQAEACADFAIDSLNNRTAYIITTTKDSALAESYRKSIEKRGGKVANTVVFNFDKMAYYDVVQEIEAAKRQEICHFFIATTDKVAGKTALSAIQNQAVGFPVIAPLSWLEDDQTPIARLASNEIYFYAPFFVNERTKRVKKFTSDFVSRTRVIPSKYAYMGYEAMYQFGMALYLFGSDFPNKIRQFGESTEPQIFNRLDYKDAQVNQHVPILKLENGKLRDIKKYEPEDFED